MSHWPGTVRAELDDARHRVHAVADPLDAAAWAAAPAPKEWSVAECVMHLNLTSRAFVPRLSEALDRAPRTGCEEEPGLGLTGAFLWWALTLRLPVKTTEPFVPGPPRPKPEVLGEFDGLQGRLAGLVDDAAGRDVRASKIVSPFDARLCYNVYAALRVLTAHQRLHVRQASAAAVAAGRRAA